MIYFDNAATSFPKSRPVEQAVIDAVRFYGGNPGRGGHRMAMRVSEKVFEVRQKAADFFGAAPENVIFTQNCTHALNIALKGVMEKGGHIIASVLDHNAVLRPLAAMEKAGRISWSAADVFEEDPDETVRAFERLIRPDTRAVVCTHASNVTGTVLPVGKIAALCQKHGLVFILDAAQTAGVLPVRLSMGPDIICVPCHKGLGAVSGGLLILREGISLPPLTEGGTGSASLSLEPPGLSPDRHEAGTLNTAGILSLGAGLDVLTRRGIERICRHESALCARFYGELRRTPGVFLLTKSFRAGEKAPLVSFNVRDLDAAAVSSLLSDRGFMLRGGYHCAALAHPYLGTEGQGAVRFSPGPFNTPAQTELLLREVKKIAQNPSA
ncbi:MAG: aminotransferase class V-fold PLP-dependent enzyme [Oscillospiraceae bacterium]|nr:aminotransferase class V-fold PLP-dependent enzyme [Oscillospiraceae bacterium]